MASKTSIPKTTSASMVTTGISEVRLPICLFAFYVCAVALRKATTRWCSESVGSVADASVCHTGKLFDVRLPFDAADGVSCRTWAINCPRRRSAVRPEAAWLLDLQSCGGSGSPVAPATRLEHLAGKELVGVSGEFGWLTIETGTSDDSVRFGSANAGGGVVSLCRSIAFLVR